MLRLHRKGEGGGNESESQLESVEGEKGRRNSSSPLPSLSEHGQE